MTIPAHRTPKPYWLTFLLLCGIAACDAPDSDLPLIVQRDSAGIRIIEAMRPLWGDSSLWSLDPQPLLDLTLSGSGPGHEFFRVRGLTQRADGALVLANRGAQEIRLYSPEGEFLGAMGGRGQGPGEFSNLQRLKLVGDTVVVLDYDGRVTVVGPDMELVRTFTLPHNVQDLHPLGDGTMLGESTVWAGLEEVVNQLIRPPLALVRFDLDGAWIDSLGVRPGRESYSFSYEDNAGTGPALFAKIGQVAALGSRVFYGSSDLMQVEELDPAGDITRILRIPDYPLDLSAAQVAAERASRLEVDLPPGMTLPPWMRRTVEALPAPATRPAYAEMLVDPSGAVWLELFRAGIEQEQPQEWLILDADGTWLGTVEVPDRFSVTDITMDAVLGVWRDELDIEHPQVLRLTRDGA
ncbi:MAG: hypothetical protein OXH08_05315 [Gammaproteobacteria bacterium]|nr:hypothetical protein [Gammaproteobacteria bacterium]